MTENIEVGTIWENNERKWNIQTQDGVMTMDTKDHAESVKEDFPGLCGPDATPEEIPLVEAMKHWAIENYSKGADTMVECWADYDYLNVIRQSPEKDAWEILKSVAEVWLDRQEDAKNSAF